MKRSAGMLFVLFLSAIAAAAQAAAADRFVPADPKFVVANVKAALPDPELRELIARWRHNTSDDAASVALADAFLDRAHRLREPMYVGRAEAVLAQAARRPGATSTAQRLYAQTLQYRHDFSTAEGVLGSALRAAPYDAAARAQRASLRLVRGDFAGARVDCTRLLSGGGAGQAGAASQAIALACLAQVQASSDRLEQAQSLLATYPAPPTQDGPIRAYWLTVRGELHERANQLDRAIADYGAALTLAPENDAIRATLADALVARGEQHEARELLAVERPGLALLVRRAACAHGAERATLRAQAAEWLELEAARGDSIHQREAALLALDGGDAAQALLAARANFQQQKELADVRLLARAAVAASDADARRQLGDWLRSTGYRDAVTEEILAGAGRG
jgi:1,2-phenylacetyl-CoA epoxidase PaaB subunit